MTAIEPMVHKNSRRFFNICPRGKRKPHKERLKDFTAPKDLKAAPVLPHFEVPETQTTPTISKLVVFKEIQDEYPVPEYKLLRVVLFRAYQDLSCHGEYMRDARAWILSSSTDPYSFLWICEHLDISDESVRLFRKFACDTLN